METITNIIHIIAEVLLPILVLLLAIFQNRQAKNINKLFRIVIELEKRIQSLDKTMSIVTNFIDKVVVQADKVQCENNPKQ